MVIDGYGICGLIYLRGQLYIVFVILGFALILYGYIYRRHGRRKGD